MRCRKTSCAASTGKCRDAPCPAPTAQPAVAPYRDRATSPRSPSAARSERGDFSEHSVSGLDQVGSFPPASPPLHWFKSKVQILPPPERGRVEVGGSR